MACRYMRKWIISAVVVILVVLIAAPFVALHILAPRIHALLLERTKDVLQTHFASNVEFADFSVSLTPRVTITITDLVLRYRGRTDIPPLIQVAKVSMNASLRSILERNPEIALVSLDGLKITMPPRVPGSPSFIHGTDQDLAKKYPALIDEMVADDADIVVLPSQPGKKPHEFPIHRLHLENLAFDRPADFQAVLTNAVPKGEINSFGQFGPWVADDPAETNATGKYTFYNADLGTIKGLNGILSSVGEFDGPLDYLTVNGETDTPDFSLRTADHPVFLHTDFSAIVDGTNGDTYLKSVTARFLHTTLQVTGSIVDESKSIKGRTIELTATSTEAHAEDLIRLTTKGSRPVMSGDVRLRTTILIPERNEDLVDRLRLQGEFGIGDIQFTNPSTQGEIDALSRKGQGRPEDIGITDVISQLKGQFQMKDAVIDFSNLSFSVAGAAINLDGTYSLDSQEMDFHGKLKLQAKLSQTTTGVKSFFLKAVDPFFKGKDAGTVVAIKITGTKDSPSFGLDHGKDDSHNQPSSKGQ
jgi:AsmA-like C-terminal region